MRAGDLSTFQEYFIHILLLAEDGDPNCHACSVLAHNFKGYIIDFCMAGQITRQFLDERRPDIVVVDCRPDCNSCRRFFSLLEGCADRPATIMIADLPELGRLEDYFAAQIDDIILKPYQDRELLTRVKIAAERRKSRTGLPEKNVAYDPELMEKMKLESLSLLAGGIAHDLNNYLAVILGSISLPGNARP